jgi:hypothetical protein
VERWTAVSDETRQITYEGPPALAHRLVQSLKDEGLTAYPFPHDIDWTPPEEERGVPEMAEATEVTIVTTGAIEAMKLGVRKFRERFGTARVKIEGEDEDD